MGSWGGNWRSTCDFCGQGTAIGSSFLPTSTGAGTGNPDDPATWDCHRDGFAERTAVELADAVKSGVSGLKIFKRFGLEYRNVDGSLIKIDDSRFDPIWKACGELGIPVLIHTADPAAFFDPVDETNERWEELSRHPEWSFYGEIVSDSGRVAYGSQSGDR